MSREFRIAAAGIILNQGKILLARYKGGAAGTYLVGPGGGVVEDEPMEAAVTREVLEETGVEVSANKMVFVEDLLSTRYRMVKIWFLCNVVGGELRNTAGAKEEGIVDVCWYSKEDLETEVVYPKAVKEMNWDDPSDTSWSKYFTLQQADF